MKYTRAEISRAIDRLYTDSEGSMDFAIVKDTLRDILALTPDGRHPTGYVRELLEYRKALDEYTTAIRNAERKGDES